MESPSYTSSCPNLFVVLREPSCLVIPAEQTPSRTFSLPVVEIFSGFGSILTSHMLLFESQDHARLTKTGVQDPSIASPAAYAVRKSLEKLLVPYFPLAGRVQAPPQHGSLQLMCNSTGVVFVEACANISMAQLKKLDKRYWSELECQFSVEKAVDVPPLLVQITMLACGGFVLSIKLIQSLCDNMGVLHFFRGWSELVRGDARVSTLPIWDPQQFSMRQHPSARRFHFPSLQLVDQKAIVGDHYHQKQLELHNLVPITHIAISFDEISAIIRLLKKEGTRHCNTFELLAAHFWRERTRALGILPSDRVTLFFPAPDDLLPTLFYGEYAFNCYVFTTAGELLQKNLSHAVQLIQEAARLAQQNLPTCIAEFARLHCNSSFGAPAAVFIVTLFCEEVSDLEFGCGKPPLTTDAVRVPSPVNVASITPKAAGSATNALDLLVSNIPATLMDKFQLQIHDSPSLQDSRL